MRYRRYFALQIARSFLSPASSYRIALSSLFAGLLRLHGEDIARLQRLFDPLAITLLFIAFNGTSLAAGPEGALPAWCWWLAWWCFSARGIYASYRSRSCSCWRVGSPPAGYWCSRPCFDQLCHQNHRHIFKAGHIALGGDVVADVARQSRGPAQAASQTP